MNKLKIALLTLLSASFLASCNGDYDANPNTNNSNILNPNNPANLGTAEVGQIKFSDGTTVCVGPGTAYNMANTLMIGGSFPASGKYYGVNFTINNPAVKILYNRVDNNVDFGLLFIETSDPTNPDPDNMKQWELEKGVDNWIEITALSETAVEGKFELSVVRDGMTKSIKNGSFNLPVTTQ